MRIHGIYTKIKDHKARLYAEIETQGRSVHLWYEVEEAFAEFLVADRCDAFVTALLYSAIFLGEDIISDIGISKGLAYRMNEMLIPAVAYRFHRKRIRVCMPECEDSVLGRNLVGTGYSGGVDSMYTVMQYSKKQSEYPLDYLCVVNAGVYEGPEAYESFLNACEKAQNLAEDLNIKSLAVNTNLHEFLKEQYLDVYSFRLMSAILALQKLFGTYLFSSGHTFGKFNIADRNPATSDLLNINVLSTDTLKFYCTGAGVTRVDKIRALTEYPPSYTRLHPCFIEEDQNCGHCKKDRRDTVTLWALGKLELYSSVYNIGLATRMRQQNIAFILANRENDLYGEVLELLKEKQIQIPQSTYRMAECFRKGMENCRKKEMMTDTTAKQSLIPPEGKGEQLYHGGFL